MTDKEMLNYAKAYRALTKTTAEISNNSEDQKQFEIIDWLIKQAEQKQKFLERLNKRGIEIRKLKSQLSQCREKIKKLEWNLLITKGTADQSMRANKSNYELANKLEKENKRLREALEFYADENSYRKIGFAELYSPAEKDFGQKARQALEESK